MLVCFILHREDPLEEAADFGSAYSPGGFLLSSPQLALTFLAFAFALSFWVLCLLHDLRATLSDTLEEFLPFDTIQKIFYVDRFVAFLFLGDSSEAKI